jgi:hydrogenase expression/formation protein HypC
MCLGVPMRIMEINGFSARCEARGIERKASLFLLQHEDLQVGDLVMIHVGNAIQKMTEDDAQTAWDLYDEILELETVGAGVGAGVGVAHGRDSLKSTDEPTQSRPWAAPTGKSKPDA